MPHPSQPSPESRELTVPDTPTSNALLLVALRRVILSWRERASTAPERESQVYRQVEKDLAAAIATHAELRNLWAEVRRDLIQGLVEALIEQREGQP